MADFMTNYGIIITYILLAVATVTAIGFPLLRLIQNPKGAKGALIGVGILAVILGISYALSSDVNPSKMEIAPEDVKLVDMGLFTFYILAVAAIGSTVYAEVSKMLK